MNRERKPHRKARAAPTPARHKQARAAPMLARHRKPAAFAFALALLVSVGIHLPVYTVLGYLNERLSLANHERSDRSEVVEVDFVEQADGQEPEADKPLPKPAEAQPEQERKQLNLKVAQPVPAEQKQQEPKVEVLNKQSIEQRSDNPDVAPPEDSQFVAEQNRRVEKETVAKVTNYQRDDQVTELPEDKAIDSEEDGNSDEQDVADLKEQKGDESRAATQAEAEAEKSTKQPVSVNRAQTVATSKGASSQDAELTDPESSIVISKNAKAANASAFRSAPTARGVDGLKLSWQSFEQTMGQDQLRADSEQYIRQHRSKHKGSGQRQKRWKEFRSAIENFVPNVTPGNQTALNAAASPFASYLAAVHRRLHREFADRFLASLPTSEPLFNDPNLRTKLEIIITQDGTIDRVGVVETSGFLPFDYGAFNAVMRGQPYPSAPQSILSGDGRVYLHWAFYRNERQCGTFNAEPYILPNPPGMAPHAPMKLRDAPEWGGVVPSGTAPLKREEKNGHEEPVKEKSPKALPSKGQQEPKQYRNHDGSAYG
ncbi:MAG: TonB C-terminal domain-containing protein [Myxococcales bacterium]|nr:MAG: TonB C-terminal domain-containing protein [Myxococcales bacterium]